MDKRTDAKEKVLFFSGIALGTILGIFGNICASYLYEWNKDNLWFFVIATVGFLAAIGSVFRQMRHFSKRNTTETPTSEK